MLSSKLLNIIAYSVCKIKLIFDGKQSMIRNKATIFISNVVSKCLPYFLVGAGGIYYPIGWFRRRTFRKGKVNKILVMAPYHGIGNLVLLIPMLKGLKKDFSKAKVSLLLGSGAAVELFSGQSLLDEVIKFDAKKTDLLGGVQFFFRKIRPKKFDLSIATYLGDYFYFSVWSFIAGIPYRIGTYGEDQKYLPTNFINTWATRMENQKHEIQQYLDLLHFIGLNPEKTAPELIVSKIEADFADKYLTVNGIDRNDLLLGVHPGSSSRWRWKRWPLSRFVAVAEKFSNIYNAKVIFFIGPDDKDIRKGLSGIYSRHIIIEGLSLKKVIALINRCNIFLSNDSGLMHIAATMKVPVVAIFGPTLYERNKPFGDDNIIVRKNLPCSPCFKFFDIQCEEKECLNSITSEEVFQILVKKYEMADSLS